MSRPRHSIEDGHRVLDSKYEYRAGPLQTPCKEWTGSTTNGRARMRFNGRNGPVARFAWAREHGPIPAGRIICHKCDNPLCYEVPHLYAGTYHDNMMDCYERGQRTRLHPFARKSNRLYSTTLAELAFLLSRQHFQTAPCILLSP